MINRRTHTPIPSACVRKAHPNDAETIASLHASCMPGPWIAKDWRSRLSTPHTHCWLAGPKTQDLGFLAIRQVADEAEILVIAVIPAARRKGIARKLMRHAIGTLRQGPTQKLFLEVSVLNMAAHELYKDFDFNEIGRRSAYYNLPDGSSQDAFVLALDLTDGNGANSRI